MNEYDFDGRNWVHYESEIDNDGNEGTIATFVSIMDVPVRDLVFEWESLIVDLKDNEERLLQLKEYIAEQSFKIEQETDFKTLYGKNNADVMKHHIKTELADVYDDVTGLELSINWIKGYIPLLRECIRIKGE